MKLHLIAPALLALSLAACDVRVGNITPAAQSSIVASESDVLQQVQIGSTTRAVEKNLPRCHSKR